MRVLHRCWYKSILREMRTPQRRSGCRIQHMRQLGRQVIDPAGPFSGIMEQLMRGSAVVLTFGLALFLASAAFGQGSPGATPVKARQGQFREIGTAFKAINDELRKDTPGRFILGSSSRLIATNLRQVSGMFPVGSGPARGIETKALPEIWNNRAAFDRLNETAVAQADSLAAAIRINDSGEIRVQVRALGETCKSCHGQFRVAD